MENNLWIKIVDMNYFEKKTKEGLKSEQIVSELEETDEYGTPKYHLYILQNETEFKIKKPIKVYYEKQWNESLLCEIKEIDFYLLTNEFLTAAERIFRDLSIYSKRFYDSKIGKLKQNDQYIKKYVMEHFEKVA